MITTLGFAAYVLWMCVVGLIFLGLGLGALGYSIVGDPDLGQYQRPEQGYVVSHPSDCHVGLSLRLGGKPEYTRATSWTPNESVCPAYGINDEVYFDSGIENMPVATTPDNDHGSDGVVKAMTAVLGLVGLFGAFYVPITQIKSHVRYLRRRQEREERRAATHQPEHAADSTTGQ